MKSKTLFIIAMLYVALTNIAVAQQTDDHEAVRQAVLDYVEGIYQVQPERIERSVSREMAKVGYWREKDGAPYAESRMSFDQLVGVAKNWNKNGRVDAKTALKEVVIFEVVDQTAFRSAIASTLPVMRLPDPRRFGSAAAALDESPAERFRRRSAAEPCSPGCLRFSMAE